MKNFLKKLIREIEDRYLYILIVLSIFGAYFLGYQFYKFLGGF